MTSLWLISGVGLTGLGLAVYLWRQVARLNERASQAYIMEERYEEEKRKNAALKRQAELHNVPMPSSYTNIIDGL